MRDEALEEGRGEGRPDEPLGNAGVGRPEGVQVRIGLPLLEQELNLPSETVEFTDGGEIEVLAREVGDERHVRPHRAVPDEQEPHRGGVVCPAHEQVGRGAPETVSDSGQVFPTPRHPLTPPDPRADDNGVDTRLEAHDEGAPGMVHVATIVNVHVPPIGEDQLAVQIAGCRQKLSLAVGIRCEVDMYGLVVEETHRGMQFPRRRGSPS